jgi:signal transduction histidine kinase
LVQSEKLAALGQLSVGTAHELRNPLSALSTAAYCLAQALQQDGGLSDDAQRYLAVIQRNVERTQRIITSVLAFARPSQRDDPSAVEAIKKGAADYLTKPLSPDQLLFSLERLFERLRLEEEENRQLREMLAR